MPIPGELQQFLITILLYPAHFLQFAIPRFMPPRDIKWGGQLLYPSWEKASPVVPLVTRHILSYILSADIFMCLLAPGTLLGQ